METVSKILMGFLKPAFAQPVSWGPTVTFPSRTISFAPKPVKTGVFASSLNSGISAIAKPDFMAICANQADLQSALLVV